jgi:hypothetical protein
MHSHLGEVSADRARRRPAERTAAGGPIDRPPRPGAVGASGPVPGAHSLISGLNFGFAGLAIGPQ